MNMPPSPWVNRRRPWELLLAAAGLIVLSPVLLLIALLVWLEDGSPMLFRQTRVGRQGRPFSILKFRSMRQGHSRRQITIGGDARITKVGRWLRRLKLDELPQLWNVVRGDMSLIGPRPEVPVYVDMESPLWQQVLSARPGITDLASLVYRDEENLLAQAADPDVFYRQELLPDKLRLNIQYLQLSSPWHDLRLLMLTIYYAAMPALFRPDRVRQEVLGDL